MTLQDSAMRAASAGRVALEDSHSLANAFHRPQGCQAQNARGSDPRGSSGSEGAPMREPKLDVVLDAESFALVLRALHALPEGERAAFIKHLDNTLRPLRVVEHLNVHEAICDAFTHVRRRHG